MAGKDLTQVQVVQLRYLVRSMCLMARGLSFASRRNLADIAAEVDLEAADVETHCAYRACTLLSAQQLFEMACKLKPLLSDIAEFSRHLALQLHAVELLAAGQDACFPPAANTDAPPLRVIRGPSEEFKAISRMLDSIPDVPPVKPRRRAAHGPTEWDSAYAKNPFEEGDKE